MYFFTSDWHLDHKNVMKYSNRPFGSVEEMNEELIRRHNEVVGKGDVVVHAGDLTMINNKERIKEWTDRLNGTNIFLQGNHDTWLPKSSRTIWERTIDGQKVVVCHFPMRRWNKSHYNSWHLFGHMHGNIEPIGKSWEIGVDVNNYTPVSWEQIKVIMRDRPDNEDFRG